MLKKFYPWFTRNTKKAYGVSPPPMSLAAVKQKQMEKTWDR
jgi:hypothetical protein